MRILLSGVVFRLPANCLVHHPTTNSAQENPFSFRYTVSSHHRRRLVHQPCLFPGRPRRADPEGGNLTFTFIRNRNSKTPDTTAIIQVGTDLVTWPVVHGVPDAPVAADPGVSVIDNGDGTDTIILTLPLAPEMRKFARLTVEIE